MKATTSWSYREYVPLLYNRGEIYVCRLAPEPDSFSVDWYNIDGEKTYILKYRKETEENWNEITVPGSDSVQTTATVSGLDTDCDYVFYVSTPIGKRSAERLVRTGFSEGITVNYLHPRDNYYAFSGNFLCSPSLVRHPDGYLLASMDLHTGNRPQNLTLLYRSDDNGSTWKHVSDIYPSFWGKLFIHKNELYLLSVSTEYGDLLIGKSTDGGKTFCQPTVLLRGGCKTDENGVHKNPQPVVYYNHRIWNTMEWGSWKKGGHAPMVMSADVDSDLLDARSWLFSEPVQYNPEWEGTAVGRSAGLLEGCPVIAPDGKLYVITRYEIRNCEPSYGLALVFRVDENNPEAPLEYKRAMKFDGNHSKFVIKRDEKTGTYYSIIARIKDSDNKDARNICSLVKSEDLVNWVLVKDIWNYENSPKAKVGFQYVDWFIENDDILLLSRTAMNDADTFHNSNYSKFFIIKDFRNL